MILRVIRGDVIWSMAGALRQSSDYVKGETDSCPMEVGMEEGVEEE